MSLSSPTGATDPPHGSSDANADVATLSYERAREELVSVVQHLEAGQVPLEEALTLWERGEALAARCQAINVADGAADLRGALDSFATAASAVAPS